jgi:hypothetical protein
MAELDVQVVDDEIIVMPGSHYSVTYYKPAKSPQLVAKACRTETIHALQ